MRRLFLGALLCALGLLCLPLLGAFAETVTLDGIRYELDKGAALFIGFEEGAQSVTVHAAVRGYPTDYFGKDEEWERNTSVKELIVAPEVTDLNQISSFTSLLYRCEAAERIVLPASLIRISDSFTNTGENLREFVVEAGNPNYQAVDGVLFSRDGKTLLSFPNGREGQYAIPPGTVTIVPGAFGYNKRLQGLSIPEGVTNLAAGAFWGMAALEEISLPASLKSMESGALPYEGALKRITVADNNPKYQSLDGVLFSRDGKTLLAFPSGRGGHYDIPPGTAAIGERAFGWNDSLVSLTVPEGMTELMAGAFSSMSGLKQIHLPASLRMIGEGALPSRGALLEITVAEGSNHYQAYDGALFSRNGKTLLVYPAGRAGRYEIPPGTLYIAQNAFGSNDGLTAVMVPDGVVALTQYLFSNTGGLEEIYLPASLKEIGEWALPGYGALKRVEVAKDNPRYYSIDGVLFEGEELIFYPPAHGFSYDVPPGTKRIRERAFADHESLQSITIPRSITEIGDGMFSGCTALARVSLPITLTSIGRSAFSNCIALSGVTLPPGLVTLRRHAFYNCPMLTSVKIPEGLTVLEDNVFGAHAPDFALYAGKSSVGYWYAWENGLLWAEPGGTPGTVKPVDRQTQSAVVNCASNQELLNLSAKPSKGAKSLGKYKNGTTVQVMETQNGWAHVRLYDREGYMPLESLMLTDKFNAARITWGRKRQVMAEPLRLYAGAFEEAPSEVITEDISMRILDTEGVWYHVVVQGRDGYVPVHCLNVVGNRPAAFDEEFAYYYVVANPDPHDRLHLRREPSVKSESLGRYFNGTQVEAIDFDRENDGWCHVRVDGKEGYMMIQYLLPIEWGGEGNLWGHG